MVKKRPARKIAPSKLLAANLLSWSKRYDLESDPYVEYVTLNLVKRRNLPLIAEMDPILNLPTRPGKMKMQSSMLIQTLTVIRNTLVFAPVALTWAAVSHATSGFAKYVDENPDSVANFLQFWQNGYGYLAEEWKIGTVANLDFLIIMVVIALTLYISFTTNRVTSRRHFELSAFREDRMRIAIELKEFLDTKRRVSPVTVNQSLAKSVQNLENSTSALDLSTEKLHQRLTQLENFTR